MKNQGFETHEVGLPFMRRNEAFNQVVTVISPEKEYRNEEDELIVLCQKLLISLNL
ncbi:hypothetical protein PN465_16960 [Nodularia spumigena CS-584]|jgi:hypothetical protein|uniref:hypothetical protein n=1 Tax=Nodularia spumigena TaxID=70799 RepID=UPI0000EAAD39|nr:hypothetical protein [Nodularia spumigena]AHJ27870.1 hypothetical protein NSP_15360 [Nodularia spumigena CCY9414]EAW46777.1 hypothetical protein N9414_17408 [Nodularia spumigena CCY9414]MDB9343739.1 hypothetical protein [Nodularia spumigena CS-588/06]MDB9368359.1 hypothetical protein [Nodularia spumigena CS-586/05]MDB9383892.1 hypothetical protein [Nodularia spumigena CS-584]